MFRISCTVSKAPAGARRGWGGRRRGKMLITQGMSREEGQEGLTCSLNYSGKILKVEGGESERGALNASVADNLLPPGLGGLPVAP